jgi:DNA-binding transcriptional LysR family regulator
MVVSDIDLRLLRVFCAVVEAGGFSYAQAILNVSQSTISTQMSQLEARLGVTLCHRGRGGFKLTEQGEACYRNTLDLFKSVHAFQRQSDELRGASSGVLRLGFLDNVITDLSSPVRSIFHDFLHRTGNRTRLALEVLAPQDMERRLLDRRLDAALGIFHSTLPSLTYMPLYRERDSLVCAGEHPLATLSDRQALREAIQTAPKVVRSFLETLEFSDPELYAGQANVAVVNIEAAAYLILCGSYIGFLPQHYARPWIERGEMVELLPDEFERYSDFSLVVQASGAKSAAVQTFLESVALVQQTCARAQTSLAG